MICLCHSHCLNIPSCTLAPFSPNTFLRLGSRTGLELHCSWSHEILICSFLGPYASVFYCLTFWCLSLFRVPLNAVCSVHCICLSYLWARILEECVFSVFNLCTYCALPNKDQTEVSVYTQPYCSSREIKLEYHILCNSASLANYGETYY